MPDQLGSVGLTITTNASDLARGLSKAKGQVSQFGRDVAKSGSKYGKQFADSYAKSFRSIGSAVQGSLAALSVPMARFATDSVKTIASFESGLNKVAAVSGATGKSLQRLENQAKHLGATTQFSATQATEAMTFLAQAGLNVDDVYKSMPATLNLAAASQMDLGRAADITSNILSGFRKPASEAARVTDILAQAARSSNTNVSQFGDAMKKVAPLAATLNQPIEKVGAQLGVLANAGIQGAEAGTALKSMMNALLAPTGRAKAVLDKFGIRSKDLVTVIRELDKAGASSVDMIHLFGSEFNSTASALRAGLPEYEDLYESLVKSEGAAKDMADTINKGLLGAWTEFKSAVEGLQISLGDAGITGLLTNLVKAMTGLVRTVTKLPDPIKLLGTGLAALATAFASAKTAALLFNKALGSTATVAGATGAAGALGKLKIAATGLLSTTNLLLAAIGGAAYQVWDGYQDSLKKTKKELDDLAEATNAAKDNNEAFYELLGRTAPKLDDLKDKLKETREEASKFRQAWDWMFNINDRNSSLPAEGGLTALLAAERHAAGAAEEAGRVFKNQAVGLAQFGREFAETISTATDATVEATRKAAREAAEAAKKSAEDAKQAVDEFMANTRHRYRQLKEEMAGEDNPLLAWAHVDATAAQQQLDSYLDSLKRSSTAATSLHDKLMGLAPAFDPALAQAGLLEGALQRMGVKSSAQMQAELEQMAKDYEIVASAADSTQHDIEQAQIKILQKQREFARLHGQEWTREQDRALKELEGRYQVHAQRAEDIFGQVGGFFEDLFGVKMPKWAKGAAGLLGKIPGLGGLLGGKERSGGMGGILGGIPGLGGRGGVIDGGWGGIAKALGKPKGGGSISDQLGGLLGGIKGLGKTAKGSALEEVKYLPFLESISDTTENILGRTGRNLLQSRPRIGVRTPGFTPPGIDWETIGQSIADKIKLPGRTPPPPEPSTPPPTTPAPTGGKETWDAIKDHAIDTINEIGRVATAAWNQIGTIATGTWNQIGGFAAATFNSMISFAATAYQAVAMMAAEYWKATLEISGVVWNAVGQVATLVLNEVGTNAVSMVNQVGAAFVSAANQTGQAFVSAANQLSSVISKMNACACKDKGIAGTLIDTFTGTGGARSYTTAGFAAVQRGLVGGGFSPANGRFASGGHLLDLEYDSGSGHVGRIPPHVYLDKYGLPDISIGSGGLGLWGHMGTEGFTGHEPQGNDAWWKDQLQGAIKGAVGGIVNTLKDKGKGKEVDEEPEIIGGVPTFKVEKLIRDPKALAKFVALGLGAAPGAPGTARVYNPIRNMLPGGGGTEGRKPTFDVLKTLFGFRPSAYANQSFQNVNWQDQTNAIMAIRDRAGTQIDKMADIGERLAEIKADAAALIEGSTAVNDTLIESRDKADESSAKLNDNLLRFEEYTWTPIKTDVGEIKTNTATMITSFDAAAASIHSQIESVRAVADAAMEAQRVQSSVSESRRRDQPIIVQLQTEVDDSRRLHVKRLSANAEFRQVSAEVLKKNIADNRGGTRTALSELRDRRF